MVDLITRQLAPFAKTIAQLCVVAAVLSAFMNNVGALALLLPVALKTANEQGRSPSLILMPLAFASILGGMITMIGTLPNIIIFIFRSGSRRGGIWYVCLRAGGRFGGCWACVCDGHWVAFDPQRFSEICRKDEMFALKEISPRCVCGRMLVHRNDIGRGEKDTGEKMMIFGFIKKDGKVMTPNRNNLVRAGSRYLVKVDPVDLKAIMDQSGLRLEKELRSRIDNIEGEDVNFTEVVVTPNSQLVGRSRAFLRSRTSNSVVLMAVARQGQPIQKRLGDVEFRVGDVLLLQGAQDNMKNIGLAASLAMAEREVRVGIFPRSRSPWPSSLQRYFEHVQNHAYHTVLSWGNSGLCVFGYPAVARFVPGNRLARHRATGRHDSREWRVAVQGLTGEIATAVNNLTESMPAWSIVALMVVTMCLSDVINNAATALIMAPIGVGIALQMGVSPDPFLMAVAVGHPVRS